MLDTGGTVRGCQKGNGDVRTSRGGGGGDAEGVVGGIDAEGVLGTLKGVPGKGEDAEGV